uniref:Xylanase inhibitor C-terminal domain-containing protein n=1 Tax=Salix viminalis TaxID=40686 RepID=A0A6N2LXU9_SALVM
MILYGSGTTVGIALSETLHLHGLSKPNFLVGCSVLSSHQPAELLDLVVDFHLYQANLVLVSSLTVYSLVDSTMTPKRAARTARFCKKPMLGVHSICEKPKVEDKSSFSVYYYLGLRRITIGGHHVKMPYKYLSPERMAMVGLSSTQRPRSRSLHITDYKRIKEFEDVTGLGPCFNVSDAKTVSFPELRLYFKGGADVALPVENYFAFVGGGVACLTMVTGPERVDGPDGVFRCRILCGV